MFTERNPGSPPSFRHRETNKKKKRTRNTERERESGGIEGEIREWRARAGRRTMWARRGRRRGGCRGCRRGWWNFPATKTPPLIVRSCLPPWPSSLPFSASPMRSRRKTKESLTFVRFFFYSLLCLYLFFCLVSQHCCLFLFYFILIFNF